MLGAAKFVNPIDFQPPKVPDIHIAPNGVSRKLEWRGNVPEWFQQFSEEEIGHLFKPYKEISHAYDSNTMSICDNPRCGGKSKGQRFLVCQCRAQHIECVNHDDGICCSTCHTKPYQVEFGERTFPLHKYYYIMLSALLQCVPKGVAVSRFTQEVLCWIMKLCDCSVSEPNGLFLRFEAFDALRVAIQKISRRGISDDAVLFESMNPLKPASKKGVYINCPSEDVKEVNEIASMMVSNFRANAVLMGKPFHDTSVIRLQPRILSVHSIFLQAGSFEDTKFRVNPSTQARFLKLPCHRIGDYCFSVDCLGNKTIDSLGECSCGIFHTGCNLNWKPRNDKSGIECGGSACTVCKKTVVRQGISLSNIEAVTLHRHAMCVALEIFSILQDKKIGLQLYNFLVEALETMIVDVGSLTKAITQFLAELDKAQEMIHHLTLTKSFSRAINPRGSSQSNAEELFSFTAKEPAHENAVRQQISLSFGNLVQQIRSSIFDVRTCYTELSVEEFIQKYLMPSGKGNASIGSTASLHAIYQGLCHRLKRRPVGRALNIVTFGTLLAGALSTDKRFRMSKKSRVTLPANSNSGFTWDASQQELRADCRRGGRKICVWSNVDVSDDLTDIFPILEQIRK